MVGTRTSLLVKERHEGGELKVLPLNALALLVYSSGFSPTGNLNGEVINQSRW